MSRGHSSLEQTLRDLGYRLTPQRSLILSCVQSRDEHFSAEDICADVRRKNRHVNISTVYRTLETLARLGLVTCTDLGYGRPYYHPASKGRHHHLVCRGCGHVKEIEDSALQPLADKLLFEHGFEASLGHFAIFGRCSACLQSPRPADLPGRKEGDGSDDRQDLTLL